VTWRGHRFRPLLRGEPLEVLSHEFGVEAHRLAAWRDDFLEGGKEALKASGRTDPQRTASSRTLSARVRVGPAVRHRVGAPPGPGRLRRPLQQLLAHSAPQLPDSQSHNRQQRHARTDHEAVRGTSAVHSYPLSFPNSTWDRTVAERATDRCPLGAGNLMQAP
jgi:hypothetical protein